MSAQTVSISADIGPLSADLKELERLLSSLPKEARPGFECLAQCLIKGRFVSCREVEDKAASGADRIVLTLSLGWLPEFRALALRASEINLHGCRSPAGGDGGVGPASLPAGDSAIPARRHP